MARQVKIKTLVQVKITEQQFEEPVNLIDFKRYLQNDYDRFLNFILKDSCKTLKRVR